MIQFNFDPRDSLIEMTISEKVTAEDIEKFKVEAEPQLREWEDAKVLERIENMTGIEPRALWEDLKLGAKLYPKLDNLKKCAVVADQKWVSYGTEISNHLFSAEIKVFKSSELEKARSWLLN